ncbi:MAG TPA: CRISPR-associated protein Cas4 [Bacillota bacterium]|nr:CRISPR-associated protein Cas4 [Bacillota bacterium]
MEETHDVYVTGTLVWYYYICERQVWLLAHQVAPDQDHVGITLGRFIHEHTYKREKKEVLLGPAKIDIVGTKDGRLVVGEVKKSSRSADSARMQLLFYLDELRKRGIDAYGELRYPKEKRRERVELTQEAIEELANAKRKILEIVYLPQPPKAKKIKYCRNCAYAELCWA